jgi:hypothetical protein
MAAASRPFLHCSTCCTAPCVLQAMMPAPTCLRRAGGRPGQRPVPSSCASASQVCCQQCPLLFAWSESPKSWLFSYFHVLSQAWHALTPCATWSRLCTACPWLHFMQATGQGHCASVTTPGACPPPVQVWWGCCTCWPSPSASRTPPPCWTAAMPQEALPSWCRCVVHASLAPGCLILAVWHTCKVAHMTLPVPAPACFPMVVVSASFVHTSAQSSSCQPAVGGTKIRGCCCRAGCV